MSKHQQYKNYTNIYEIAHGRQGDHGILLSPTRAIFSAIFSVLYLDDEETKLRLLKEEPYQYSQETLQRFESGDLEHFIDVWTESTGMVRRDGVIFYDWNKKEQLEHISRKVESSHYLNNLKIRLASAKTRREHFPTTRFFEEAHYKKDIDAGIFTIFLEEMGKMYF